MSSLAPKHCYRFVSVLVLVLFMFYCGSTNLLAQPAAQKVTKFLQKPLNGEPSANGEQYPYLGHDELSTAYLFYEGAAQPIPAGYRGCFMADDFADLKDTPVVCLKWWGSYLNDRKQEPRPQAVTKFLIAFETDVPADVNNPFSHPGQVIQTEIVTLDPDVTDCAQLGPGQYLETPVAPGTTIVTACEQLYEYCAVLKQPFEQQPDRVYWIKIVALVDISPSEAFQLQNCAGAVGTPSLCDYLRVDPFNFNSECPRLTRWGWHNRDYRVQDLYASQAPAVVPGEKQVGSVVDPFSNTDIPVWHFQDDAVSGEVLLYTDPADPLAPPIIEGQFNYQPEQYVHLLFDCTFAASYGIDGPQEIVEFSKDLAFELLTEEEPPILGACCLPDGTCVDTTSADCADQGGTYYGDGTNCINVDCPTQEKHLKFQQLPLNGEPQFSGDEFLHWGHDELSTAYRTYDHQIIPPAPLGFTGCFMADDFADTATTPVICVKWWGSYLNDRQGFVNLPQPVRHFLIAFETDVPQSPTNPWSRPGQVIQTEIVSLNATVTDCDQLPPGEYTETQVPLGGGGAGGTACERLFEYCAVLRLPFDQQPDTVYWIKIVALVDLSPDESLALQNCSTITSLCDYLRADPFDQDPVCPPLTRWGWHNRDWRFEDIYASHPPAVLPGEDKVGQVQGLSGLIMDVWHFQDDAVSGNVLMFDNSADPFSPFIEGQFNMAPERYVHQLIECTAASQYGIDGPQGIQEFSKDLAFELWTRDTVPEEPMHDLGDAPDRSNSFPGSPMTAFPPGGPLGVPAAYPTVYALGSPPHGPIHWSPLAGAYLGDGVTLENEADIGPDQDGVNNLDPPADVPNRDGRDDGVHFPLNFSHCARNDFDYDVTIVLAQDYYVNVWFDWNRDGDWNDLVTCVDPTGVGNVVDEWAVQNQWIDGAALGAGLHTLTTPWFFAFNPAGANVNPRTWMRINISEQPWTATVNSVGGAGPAAGYQYGETEDFFVNRGCACRGDVANGLALPPGDGSVVDFGDLNYLISQIAPTFSTPTTPGLLCADIADGLALPVPGGDGTVDFGDLNYMISQIAPTFNSTCLP